MRAESNCRASEMTNAQWMAPLKKAIALSALHGARGERLCNPINMKQRRWLHANVMYSSLVVRAQELGSPAAIRRSHVGQITDMLTISIPQPRSTQHRTSRPESSTSALLGKRAVAPTIIVARATIMTVGSQPDLGLSI